MYDARPDLDLSLLARRHPFHLVAQSSPVVGLQFGVLHPFLAPVLMQAADVVLALLEMDELIPNALLDEHAPCVLLHDGFFVLHGDRG